MKKGDEIRDKFNARVAILIEKDGVLHAYLSHMDFPTQLPPVRPTNLKTLDDYITVAQQDAQQRREDSSLSLESDVLLSDFAFVEPEPAMLTPPEPAMPRPETSNKSATPARKPMARDYFTFPDLEPESL